MPDAEHADRTPGDDHAGDDHVEPATDVTGTTRQVVLLGHPVAHSRSPVLHNTAFRALGLDLVYVALDVAPDDLGCVLAALAATRCAGANVTVPHKQAAHAACDQLTEEARLVGAVNTLWWVDGALHGTTTDTTGLARALAADVGDLDGHDVLLLGTGGAARAAAVALARAGARTTVAGRRPDAAATIAALATEAGGTATSIDLHDDAALTAAVDDSRVTLNATSVGMHGERLPAPVARLGDGQVAYDLVYGGDTTPFLADAAANGAATHDGRAMLVAQAEDAFAIWTGRTAPPDLLARTMTGIA